MHLLLNDLRDIALRSLRRMYRPDQRVFAFRLRRADQRDLLEGISLRYTAMALIGLAGEPEAVAIEALHGDTAHEVCGRLIGRISAVTNFGDVAATAWAAAELGHPHAERALERLKQLAPQSAEHPTVERAWALTALSVNPAALSDRPLADLLSRDLLSSFGIQTGVFAHAARGASVSRLRRHVACFADLVYPTIALSHYGTMTGDSRALHAARTCAEFMCRTQGSAGQWWWHFDVRTGRVIEGYPVYSVHQDAMAPMALFAAADACDADYSEGIRRGLEWLAHAPEIDSSLIDRKSDVIWRKVARREPNKLTRRIQAAVSAIGPSWRASACDTLFKPVQIDYESRPYHMGWILYAWPRARVDEFSSRWKGATHDRRANQMAVSPSL